MAIVVFKMLDVAVLLDAAGEENSEELDGIVRESSTICKMLVCCVG